MVDSFSELEKNLFETGLRQFGKEFREIQRLVKSKTLGEVMAFYFYWRCTARSEFLHVQEVDLPAVRELHRGRALLVLERLRREGCDPDLAKFTLDVDADWVRNELYPYIPQPNGTYIHVKDREKIVESPNKPELRKRSSPFSSFVPEAKRQRRA